VVDDSANVKITGLITTGGSCLVGALSTASGPGIQVGRTRHVNRDRPWKDFGEAQLVAPRLPVVAVGGRAKISLTLIRIRYIRIRYMDVTPAHLKKVPKRGLIVAP